LKINDWLQEATQKLQATGIESARLDAQIILSHALKMSRALLLARPEQQLTLAQADFADRLLHRRIERQPIAYLTEQKEFYGRPFYVASDVLIPRPESEAIIDTLTLLQPKNHHRLVDIGTGSGILGITAALEFPGLSVVAVDISPSALAIAKKNAQSLGAEVNFIQGDLLGNLSDEHSPVDFIVANLPYVDKTWKRSPETAHEPEIALFADDNGLAIIKRLVPQAAEVMAYDGAFILEADPQQHMAIIDFARDYGFIHRSTDGFIISLQRGGE
jgi:release factor glutamine methyltransferase